MLDELAANENFWKQRMSMVCMRKTSQMGEPSWCKRYTVGKMTERERSSFLNQREALAD